MEWIVTGPHYVFLFPMWPLELIFLFSFLFCFLSFFYFNTYDSHGPSGRTGHRDPTCSMTADPDITLGSSLYPDVTMDAVDGRGPSDQYVPSEGMVLK